MTGLIASYLAEIARLEDVICRSAKALRVSQPQGAGMFDVRWWKMQSASAARTPVLVRWESLGSRHSSRRHGAIVKPRPVLRFKAREPSGEGLAAANHPRMVELVGIARDAIERRKMLLERLSSVRASLSQSVAEHGYRTTEALARVDALHEASLAEARARSSAI